MPEHVHEHSIQYIADNVDNNVATIDGTGTFNGMGIVETVIPKTDLPQIPITTVRVTAEEIAHVGQINIEYFKIPGKLPPPTYIPLGPIIGEDSTS